MDTDYPGYILKKGSNEPQITVVARRLAALGFAIDAAASEFGSQLVSVVRLFQSLHSGPDGRPLLCDGEIGPLTWAALFPDSVRAQPIVQESNIATAALGFAISQLGVMEQPEGSNRGPEIDVYNVAADAPLGSFWCMSFVHFCFDQAARNIGLANPFPHTAGCLQAWQLASRARKTISKAEALADLSKIKPGVVFILDHGGGLGHTGFVKSCIGGTLRTVEGNSNPNGSSNGIGVFELSRRNVANKELKGFISVV